MNTVEALRFSAEFLRSKKHHIYSSKNGVTWMAMNTIDGAARVLEAEAEKRADS